MCTCMLLIDYEFLFAHSICMLLMLREVIRLKKYFKIILYFEIEI